MYTVRDNLIRGVSWSGAFLGVTVALVSYLVLAMLGVAIGGAMFSFENVRGLGWGALVWLALSLGVSALVGGFASSRAAPGIVTSSGGQWTGLLTGSLLILTLTVVTVNSLISVGQAAFGTIRGVAQTVPEMAPQGLVDDAQNMFRGIGRDDVEDAIRRAAPELEQPQVAAATETVVRVGRESFGRIRDSLSNPSQLGDVMRRESDTVYNELTGQEFVRRLEQQGLSRPQADEVARSLERRVTEIRDQLQRAGDRIQSGAKQFTEDAAEAASRGAWSWLLLAAIVLGLSYVGGRAGAREDYDRDTVQDDRDISRVRGRVTDDTDVIQPPHH